MCNSDRGEILIIYPGIIMTNAGINRRRHDSFYNTHNLTNMEENNSKRPKREGRKEGESPQSFEQRMAIETQRLVDNNNNDETSTTTTENNDESSNDDEWTALRDVRRQQRYQLVDTDSEDESNKTKKSKKSKKRKKKKRRRLRKSPPQSMSDVYQNTIEDEANNHGSFIDSDDDYHETMNNGGLKSLMNSESLMSLERKNQGVMELCNIKEKRARVMSVAKKQCMQHPTKNIYRQRLDEYEQKFDRLERQQINYNSTVAINGNNNNVNIMNVQTHPVWSAFQLPQFTQPMGKQPEMWTHPMNHETLGMASMNQATTQQLDAQASTAISSSLKDPPIQIDEQRIESKMKEFELSKFGGMKMCQSWLANYKRNYISIKNRRGGITAWIDGQRRQKADNNNSKLGVLMNELLELLGI